MQLFRMSTTAKREVACSGASCLQLGQSWKGNDGRPGPAPWAPGQSVHTRAPPPPCPWPRPGIASEPAPGSVRRTNEGFSSGRRPVLCHRAGSSLLPADTALQAETRTMEMLMAAKKMPRIGCMRGQLS